MSTLSSICINPFSFSISGGVDEIPSITIEGNLANNLANDVMIHKPAPAYCLPDISQVIFDEEKKLTVVLWSDGKPTKVHCGEGETFDRYTGFMAAVCKKLFGGTTTAKKLMNSLDKKYQAQIKAEAAEKEKKKKEAEAAEAREKAEKRRAKEDAMLMEALVEHYLLEAEAKQRAAEILAARDPSGLKVPFDDTEEKEE